MTNIHELLKATMLELEKSQSWLNRSYQMCLDIPSNPSTEQQDIIEAFTSRYSRTVDLLTNKVFRMLDNIEFLEQGSMIDIMNRVHKREIIDSVDQIRQLKDLRNRIAHEYSSDDMLELFVTTRDLTPILFTIIERTLSYYNEKKSTYLSL